MTKKPRATPYERVSRQPKGKRRAAALAAWEGAEVVRERDVSPGDTLICDAGFSCLALGETVLVEDTGCEHCGLFIRCKNGTHQLDGQCESDRDDTLVGLRRVAKAGAPRQ